MNYIFLFFVLLFSLITQSFADEKPSVSISHPVKGWLLMDYETGSVLAELNGNQQLEPASITKVMTSYLIAEALKEGAIEDKAMVTISDYARAQEGSRMFVESGSTISVHDLVLGMVIQSGNDSSIALSEYLSGSEANFVKKMNEKAKTLKMENTHFENVTGLPHPSHLTTAYDLALLSRNLIKNFPEHYKIYSQKSFTWNKIAQENRNGLLWLDPSVDGIKTGHTSSAGYNLASSAVRNDFRIISIVLGAKNSKEREKVSQELLNFGFQYFEHRTLYKANQTIQSLPVFEGIETSVPIGFIKDLSITYPKSAFADLKAKITTQHPLTAPIKQGQTLGLMEFYSKENKLVLQEPILALADIEPSGFLTKQLDRFKYKLKNRYLKLKNSL